MIIDNTNYLLITNYIFIFINGVIRSHNTNNNAHFLIIVNAFL